MRNEMVRTGMIRKRILIAVSLLLFISIFIVHGKAASPIETVRVATPGKLIDFAALYAGARLGIYRQEGLDPQFIVMRSGIIIQALNAGEIDYTTLLASSVRAAVAGLPVRVIMGLILKQTFFLLSQPEIREVKQLRGKRIAVANFGVPQINQHEPRWSMRALILIAMPSSWLWETRGCGMLRFKRVPSMPLFYRRRIIFPRSARDSTISFGSATFWVKVRAMVSPPQSKSSKNNRIRYIGWSAPPCAA